MPWQDVALLVLLVLAVVQTVFAVVRTLAAVPEARRYLRERRDG